MMKLAKLTAAVPVLIVLGGQMPAMEYNVSFGSAEVLRGKYGAFDLVSVPGLPLDNKPGAPMLPVRYIHLLLPPGFRAVAVEVVRSDEKRIEGEFLPSPGRRETPLSELSVNPEPEPDRKIYDSPEIYPPSQAELVHQGSLGGLGLATVRVYPVRCRAAERSLLQSTEVNISLKLDYSKGLGSQNHNSAIREMAGRLVDNRRDLNAWYPKTQDNRGKGGAYDILIITGAPFDTVLQRLAGWKQSRGLVAEIALTDSIYSNVTGYDHQEKIRNFIREQALSNGVSFIILGGDTAVVPARVTYAMASGYDSLAPGRDSLRADLYYSDLDGSWNADGDGIWGEIEDSVDMYPDVVVGRAPINTLADAQTFVRKVMEYEQGAATDFFNRSSLWAEMLDYVTDGAVGAEIIDRDHLSPYFRPAEKLYESLGNQTRASTIEAYRQGRHLINHIGHAWYTSMNVGPGFSSLHEIRAGDFDTIPTGGRWGIIYSIGCMPGAMERSCLAEHYVNSQEGGGAAFIGNCSYGWSLPYFSGYASSDLYNQQFFHRLLSEDATSLGSAHAAAKAQFIGASQAENEFRWVMYGLNLFGDPTLAVWTGRPDSLSVACAESLPGGANSLEVTVGRNGQPLAGASVAVARGADFAVGITDGSGRAVLPLQAENGDTLRLTAAFSNCLPAVRWIPVFGSGTQVTLLGWQVTEISGNADGQPGPGETLALSFLLKNSGGENLGDSIHCFLQRADSASALIDSVLALPAPAPGESLWTGSAFSFRADSSSSDGEYAQLGLSVGDGFGRSWGFPVGLRLAAPSPCFAGYEVDDRAGNGNGVPEPGETAILYVKIVNKGRAALAGAVLSMSTADPLVAVTDSTDSLSAIPPDSSGKTSFSIFVEPETPGPWHSSLFDLECRYAWKAWRDSFPAAFGQVGFGDDMESGSPGWYATAPESTEGGWHLSQVSCHSPGHSWYFGSEADSMMPAYSLDTLETPAFVVGPSCSLSFWQWHDFAPGWSRGVVEACGDFGARLLEVAEGQSGGWQNRRYDLSRYAPGTVLSLRFIAYCDSVRSEGWYVDDVNVYGPPTGVAGPEITPDGCSGRFALDNCRPNPSRGNTTISFSLPQSGPASLKIYNIQGRLVRTLASGNLRAGTHSIVWDGRDNAGRAVAGGMYLYRLISGAEAGTRKMLVIK